MKSRIENLELKNPTPETDIGKLAQHARDWRTAVCARDWDKALEARKEAATLFEAYPEWVHKSPTIDVGKETYIDWVFFARFDELRWREGYIQACIKNEWPARPKPKKTEK